MSISMRIQELREEKGLSQEQLADKLDVSRQAISKWENGIAKPDIENIIKLSEIFSISNDYLLTGNSRIIEPENTNLSNNVNSSTTKLIIIGIIVVFIIGAIGFTYQKYFI